MPRGTARSDAVVGRARARGPAVLAALLALLMAGTIGGGAQAFWSATGNGSGSAPTATIGAGTAPEATTSDGDVALTWDAVLLSNGTAADGYVVRRYDATAPLVPESTVTCEEVPITSCVDEDVPAGLWFYTVTPQAGTESWTGAESPPSNQVNPDPTAPTNALSVTTTSGATFLAGDTLYYRGVQAGSFTVTNALTDADSGPASSGTAALTGVTAGWSHSPSVVSTPDGGPYTSAPFSWADGTSGTAQTGVTGTDQAGNTSTTTLTFVDDSTAPSGQTISSGDDFYSSGPSVSLTFTDGADGGSGIGTRQIERARADLLAGGACGTFQPYEPVGPVDPASPFADTTVVDFSCYLYRYVVTDRVGNASAVATPVPVRVDSSFGGPRLRSAASFSVLGATAVANTGPATRVSGDLGVSPLTAVTGFPPGEVAGTTYAGGPVAAQAQTDLAAAYADAAGRTPATSIAGDQNGKTYLPGTYHSAAALSLTGSMTLDGGGNPHAVFVFRVDAAMSTAANSTVLLTNGAKASNVYWQVLGAASTGANATFVGTIMASGAVALDDGTVLIGRAMSKDGAVSFTNATIRFTQELPPTVTITGGDGPVISKDTTPTITGTTSAPAGTTVTVTVAGQVLTALAAADGAWEVTAAVVAPGSYQVRASVRDPAGNAGADTQTLLVEVNPAPVALGTAGAFAVLTAGGVTNSGPTAVSGDIGVGAASTVVGFPPGTLTGTTHVGGQTVTQALADRNAAFAEVNSRAATSQFSGDLAGRTFRHGVHHTAAALLLTGTVTLDGENDPNAVFIFQVDAAFSPAAGATVQLVRGAQASNVFWHVDDAAGTGANSNFAGTIMAGGAVTLGDGTHLNGRVLGQGTVTLATNLVGLAS